MENLENILLGALVVDALALIVLVLIQQGKGADVGAAFGGGSSNTMFGSGGGSVLTRVTTWLAIAFFCISFGLAYTAKERAQLIDSLGMPQIVEDASVDLLPDVEEVEVPSVGGAIERSVPDLEEADLPELEDLAPAELTDEQDSVDSALSESDIPDV